MVLLTWEWGGRGERDFPSRGWGRSLYIGTDCNPTTLSIVGKGDVEPLLAYHWEAVRGGEWTSRHPAYTTHRDQRQFLAPVRFHGDDASVKSLNGRKMLILSLHSEFANGDALFSRLLSALIYDDWLIPGRTIHQLMLVWLWSWQALLAGIYPLKDHLGFDWPEGSRRAQQAGEAIAGGLRFVFSGGVGDWAFHSKFWAPHLHGSGHNFICFRCCASRVIRRWIFWDTSETAGWRTTRILTSDFLDSLPLIGRHPLVDLPGFCLSLIRCDLMHACYLGMCLVTGASVIWELIANGHFGPQHLHLDIKLASAYGALLVHCRKNGLTLDCRCFTKGTFGSPHAATSTTANRAPELHVKAHDSKIITGDCCDSFSVIKP